MKITIDNKVDTKDEVLSIIDVAYGTKSNDKEGQQQLNQPSERKYYCNNKDCKKEITKDVVAFCLHDDNKPRFKSKVYCLECQTKFRGDSP